ncbi:MAG TPA: UPF0175 family protein [Phycisphaerae bacterium]|nr:UPF0175 family protein [Phycisphaerae bacterium]
MAIVVDVPEPIEAALRLQLGDLSLAAKEGLAIEGYRRRKISIGFLAKMLGMGVVEAEAWLRERGIPANYSVDDLEQDRRTMDELFGESA